MAVTVALADLPVRVVDAKFGPLVAADLPSLLDRLLLGVVMTTCPLSTSALDVPAACWIRHHMVCVRSFLSCHLASPVL